MRFHDLSIPHCGYWLEKRNMLFLLDMEKGNVPFVSSKVYAGKKSGNNMFTLYSLIHRMIRTCSELPEASFFRLYDEDAAALWFKLITIHTGNSHDRSLLAVMTSNELEKVPAMLN